LRQRKAGDSDNAEYDTGAKIPGYGRLYPAAAGDDA